jgi:leucyl-tRNA synthetase
MNGRLHLGHGYTFSKIDFIARYMRTKGYNVLFPFGFHGTGMPILACTNKIKETLAGRSINKINIDLLSNDNQIKILINMGISLEEIENFVNPYYWLQYFPKIAEEDLKAFSISADFTRSFMTTDINPYFDSFVRWYFDKFNESGYITFGLKPVIYSVKDKQPCSDHDRSKGEGVGISEFNISQGVTQTGINLFVTHKSQRKQPTAITLNNTNKYYKFTINNNRYVATKTFIDNYTQQNNFDAENIELVDTETFVKNNILNIGGTHMLEFMVVNYEIKGSGFGFKFSDNDFTPIESVKYYEPSELVVSRSGDTCIVAIVDQWFIDYSNANVKELVREFINDKFWVNTQEAKQMLIETTEWLAEWPCSRSFGLGTKLLDTNFIIDSLSDSTIYMAYYTISHLIDKLPVDVIEKYGYDIWNYIFLDSTFDDNFEHINQIEQIKQMKQEFLYWYPLDIRGSGKDLIGNHLTMCLHAHIMLWKDKYVPKSYNVNGHILFNGEKMSKSKGNFLTLADAVSQYSADVTRLVLAEGGDGITDANFMSVTAESYILKLTAEKEWCCEIIDMLSLNNGDLSLNSDLLHLDEGSPLSSVTPFDNFFNLKQDFWTNVFSFDIMNTMSKTQHAYENMQFSKVVLHGFHSMINFRDQYRLKYLPAVNIQTPKCYKYANPECLADMNMDALKFYIQNFLLAISPICPNVAEYIYDYAISKNVVLSKEWCGNSGSFESAKYGIYRDVIVSLYRNIDKRLSKIASSKEIIIYCISKYTEEESLVIKQIETFLCSGQDLLTCRQRLFESFPNITSQKLGKIFTYVNDNVSKYGCNWFSLQYHQDELHKIMEEFIPRLINDKYNHKITFNYDHTSSEIPKRTPMLPFFKIMK